MSSTDFNKSLEAAKHSIKHSDNISQKNKEWILKDFLQFLKLGDNRSTSRIFKYVNNMKKIAKHNNFRLDNVEDDEPGKRNVRSVLMQIQNSEYYHSEYSKKTKEDYFNTVKRWIECLDIDPDKSDLLPKNFTPNAKDSGKKTRPEDLPSPDQVRKLLHSLDFNSIRRNSLRNTAFIVTLWDTGCRFGELQEIQMKQVSVRKGKVKLKVEGSKQSSDRTIQVFQGSKTLRDWVERHPAKDDTEAYLFPKMRNQEYHKPLHYNSLKKTLRRCKTEADVDFKLKGEPFHIFRKAMTTFYIVNDILSAEKTFQRQGKGVDATLPTYLRMAKEDIDDSAAEGFGLEAAERGPEDNSMLQSPLLPRECSSCGVENRCYQSACSHCGETLPEASLPQGETFKDEDRNSFDNNDVAKMLNEAHQNPDQSLLDLLNKVQNDND